MWKAGADFVKVFPCAPLGGPSYIKALKSPSASVAKCWDPARAFLFQTGWFVESLKTQTLIIHVIRTNRIPFLQSRASWLLTVTTLSIMAFAMWLPYSPLASALGLVHLSGLYWPILMLTLLSYMALTQAVKAWLLRKNWI
jgi:Mg2+-importing ATPase